MVDNNSHNMTPSSSSSNVAAMSLGVAAATVVVMVLRQMKRSQSPVIRCQLQCPCGQIQGHIDAKKEDSYHIVCYCQDCRDYGNFIAQLGQENNNNKSCCVVGSTYGETSLVQVCKSAVTIDKGHDLFRLARKGSKWGYMHRYYSGCCYTPIMNTFSFLGFVGVLTHNLDANVRLLAPPRAGFPKEALAENPQREAELFVPTLLWNLIRYYPWRKAGPFDYDLEPVYFGKDEQKNQEKEKKGQ